MGWLPSFLRPSDKLTLAGDANKGQQDWHAKWDWREPSCPRTSWRHRNRGKVSKLTELSNEQLDNAFDLASTMGQHASKLDVIVAEFERRGRTPTPLLDD